MALDMTEFHAAQRRTEQAGTQITPDEWRRMGGNPQDYSGLYGNAAWWDNNGNATPAGQQAGQETSPIGNQPSTDPTTGNTVQPGTGVHRASQGGYQISPNVNTDTSVGAVKAQDDYNRMNVDEQERVNRVGETGAFGGTSNYTTDPVTGEVTRTTNLSGADQKLLDQQQGQDYFAGQQIGDKLDGFAGQGEFSYDGMPQGGQAGYAGLGNRMTQEDLKGERGRMESELYDKFDRRMEPQFQKEGQDLEQQIADRGLDPNGPQAERMRKQMSTRQNDARSDAQTQAISSAGGEMSRSYGISSDIRSKGVGEYDTTFQNQNTTRSNAQKDYTDQRYAGLNEAGTLQGMQHGIRQDQFTPTGQINVDNVDVGGIGAAWNSDATNRYGIDMGYKTATDVANIQANAGGGGGGGGGGEEAQPFDMNQQVGAGSGPPTESANRMQVTDPNVAANAQNLTQGQNIQKQPGQTPQWNGQPGTIGSTRDGARSGGAKGGYPAPPMQQQYGGKAGGNFGGGVNPQGFGGGYY